VTDPTRTLILTGASRGIGHATVRRFSEAGWRIITCSREKVPDACQYDPNWAHHIPADLSDSADLEAFLKRPMNSLARTGCLRW
jgi:NAD(P)-dependent dehydrogenase (short-subunit alcohol dehydrogenase family)